MTAAPNARPRIGGVLETSLYVDDLDRAAEFYQRVLGFEVFLRDHRMCGMGVPGGHILLLFARGGSTTPSDTPTGFIPAHDGQGALHLCFTIPVDAVSTWPEYLKAQHVEIESRVTWPRGGVSYYFRDPDNNSVELATPGLWPTY
jgi:catechol 2,3-dioxygenase-like lactoylglutathione lyase family enzyme